MTSDRTNRLPATAAEPTRSGWPADVPRPQPPVWQVFDVAVDIRPGWGALAHLGIGPGLRAGAGLAGAGLVAMLADCILGTDAALRARARIATAVLTVDVVGSPPESGSLSAVSGPSCRRAGYLLTTADVHDEAGTDVARVSGWFALRAGSPVPPAPAAPLPARPLRRADVPSVPSGRTASPAGGDLTATPLGRTLGLA